MPGFEEEAFERARQMHSRRPAPPPTGERRPEPPKPPEPAPPKPAPPEPEPPSASAPPNLLEALLRDRETGLILLLLLLLMDGDNSDPSLLFALMYLLR